MLDQRYPEHSEIGGNLEREDLAIVNLIPIGTFLSNRDWRVSPPLNDFVLRVEIGDCNECS